MTQEEFNQHILHGIERLDNKIDKLMYVLIGVGGGVLVSLITGIVSLLISVR